jgi:hypothetical protein
MRLAERHAASQEALATSRLRAKELQRAEVAALDARLVELTASSRVGTAEEVGADEDVEEEAVHSVVQHLTPFGLNRNLPWQIYATRPKRFAHAAEALADGASAMELSDALDNIGGHAALRRAADAEPYRQDPGVLAAVYDRTARPEASPRSRRSRADGGLPPVRGAEPRPHGVAAAWLSPRSLQAHKARAARPHSARVMHAVGSYV